MATQPVPDESSNDSVKTPTLVPSPTLEPTPISKPFKQKILLTYINPATGKEESLVDYFVKPGNFTDKAKGAITHWDSSKPVNTSGLSAGIRSTQVDLYQKAFDGAWGPVHVIDWSCVPNTCDLEIRRSKEAATMTPTSMYEARTSGQSWKLTGPKITVHTVFTVSFDNGSFDRLASAERTYQVGRGSVIIGSPIDIQFSDKGNTAVDYNNPNYVKPFGKGRIPQANFVVGQNGVTSLLVTAEDMVLNRVDKAKK